MFVRKTRHLLEFAFILIIVGFISYGINQLFGDAPISDDLEFDLGSDEAIESLLDK